METAFSTEVYPSDSYHSALYEIANHRFVTEDSRELRRITVKWAEDVKAGYKELGVKEAFLFLQDRLRREWR